MQGTTLGWRETLAIFKLNFFYETAAQFSFTPLHKWARKHVKRSVEQLAPLALSSFREAHPEIATNPRARYTIYPVMTPEKHVDVLCLGEYGLSCEGIKASLRVPLALKDCVLTVDSNE